MPFDATWRRDAQQFLELFENPSVTHIAKTKAEKLEQTKYCLLRRFSDFGGWKPMEETIYDDIYGDAEDDSRGRVWENRPLRKEWTWSLGLLAIAGRVHFACSQTWLGFKFPPSQEAPSCRSSMYARWIGRVRQAESPETAGPEFWAKVDNMADNLRPVPESSPLGIAVDMFSRAVAAADWRSEMLWLWITLEALFGRVDGELSHQLSERAAAFIQPAGDSRLTIYRTLKRAYGYRSKLVHGSLAGTAKEWTKDLVASVASVEQICRDALQRVLLDEQMRERFTQKSDLKGYFEELVLAPDLTPPS
ncbi:MAG: hypothetical protein IMF16_01215 [Proteobacteria bacterium]|nr:hypothetical protein [Pseudomonadota bacterium]